MSKSDRRSNVAPLVWAALIAVVALLLSVAAIDTQAQRTRTVRPAINAKSAAVRAATAEVLRETSEVRQLAVLGPVQSGAQSREEIERMLIANLDRSSTPEQVRATELTLKRLGMLPADFQFRPFLLSLLTEQVAGYYDPRTRHFYLADWVDPDAQKPVIAHELTHALQDQHFNLRRFQDWPRHDSDAQMAAHALVEGDATLAMTQYVTRDLRRQLAMLRSLITGSAGSTAVYDSAPRVIRESLVFPYSQGAAWAGVVHKRGGWDMVSSAYKKLPASTEQILHPEKYFAGEAPQRVTLGDLTPLLGKGWRMADHDVNGEWGFYLLLDEFLKSGELSRRAAAGWGGDRYALYTGRSEGDALVVLKSVWDTEADAVEFFEAYTKRTTLRYRAAPAESGAADVHLWETSEGRVFIRRTGMTVVVLEGLPAGADAPALARTL